MSFRAIAEKARDSLLYVPAAFILASLALAWITNRLDQVGVTSDAAYLLPTSTSAARTLLGTVAGATITVAALVFSITAVTVQLSATQYSPRVLQGFLRDRFQQVVVGIVMGTFTYSLVALATAGRAGVSPETADARWAATVGMVLGVASALSIVAFIDHVTRRIRVDDTVRRIAGETARSMAASLAHAREASPVESWEIDRTAEPEVVLASTTGWAQRVRPEVLLDALPAGAVARLDVVAGQYVTKGDVVLTVWPPEGGEPLPAFGHAVATAVLIGESRTIGEDPGYGIRQLVDIALRALSPGINDPATAADVVRHLVEPMREAVQHRGLRRVHRNDAGARVLVPAQRDGGDYVRAAFSEIRMAAANQPHVLTALVDSLGSLRGRLDDEGRDDDARRAIDVQLELIRSTMEQSEFAEVDRRPILRALHRLGIASKETEGHRDR